MEFKDVINIRRSIRSYKSDPIPKELLDKILEAAVIAPTAKNLQSYRLFVIDVKKITDKLLQIYSREWILTAPVLILICSIPETNWVRADGKNYSDVDSAIVMDHIILAATDLGLGTCWIGAFDAKAAKEILKLDDGLEPIAFTPVGYVKEVAPPRIRKTTGDLVTYI
jgi:nitroreductase